MSDHLDSSEIDRFLQMPSEADRSGLLSASDIDGTGNDSENVDDSDIDPDYHPSEGSEYEAISDMEIDEHSEDDAGNTSNNCSLSTNNSTLLNNVAGNETWCNFEGKQKQFVFLTDSKFNFIQHNESKPIEFYNQYLTDDILQLMTEETNRNASQVLASVRISRKSRLNEWKNTDPTEMKQFLGILMWMGLVPMPRLSDYWSKNLLYKNFIAPKIMSRNRFQLLLRFWHFNNNENLRRDGRIAKILPLLKKLNGLFCSLKNAEKEIVVDETMIPFRGRLIFRQYIPGKSHKYGIKIFKLCDKTGYTYSIKLYMGKGTNTCENTSVATSVVMELMQNHLNKGHILYTDNYYTSIELAKSLLANKTHLVGTMRKNKKNVPNKELSEKIPKGQMICLENGDGIVVTKWQDKREVRMLSSCHGLEYVETGTRDRNGIPVLKPLVICEYNKAKVGIDVSDQMSSYGTAVRKTIRWYHKVAEELLLGTAVVNSWLAYKTHLKTKAAPANARKKMFPSITHFKEQLAFSLMGLSEDNAVPEVRETGHHHLTSSSKVAVGNKMRRMRKVCKRCYVKVAKEKGRNKARNLSQVTTYCDKCPEKPFLCETCFKELHK